MTSIRHFRSAGKALCKTFSTEVEATSGKMGIFAWGGPQARGVPGVTQADLAGGVVVIIAISLAFVFCYIRYI